MKALRLSEIQLYLGYLPTTAVGMNGVRLRSHEGEWEKSAEALHMEARFQLQNSIVPKYVFVGSRACLYISVKNAAG
jgi:hypothetical protein